MIRTTKVSIPTQAAQFTMGSVAIVFAMALALVVGAPAHAAPTRSELAFVEYYDPDESSLVELSAPISWGSGHDQKLSVWRVHLDLGVVDPSGDWIPVSNNGYSNRLDTGSLIGLRIEYMLTPGIGIEYGIVKSQGLIASADTSGSTQFEGAKLNNFSPQSLGINMHLTPERALDTYIGVQVVNADSGNLSIDVLQNGTNTRTAITSDFGWGAVAGIDVPLGRRGWVGHIGMRLMKFQFRYATTPAKKQSFKSYLLYIGFGYRF